MYKSPQTTKHQVETLFYKPLIAPRVSLVLKTYHLLACCNEIQKLHLSGGKGSLFPSLSVVTKCMLEKWKIGIYLKGDYTFQLRNT